MHAACEVNQLFQCPRRDTHLNQTPGDELVSRDTASVRASDVLQPPCDDRLMDVASINELATDRLGKAVSAASGRSSVTVYSRPGARLRQTLTALAAGRVMGEHQSPGDASLLCLQGRVLVRAGGEVAELGPGDLVAVPPQRHDIEALEPSVLLLTVALH